jgi:hypothetical protein
MTDAIQKHAQKEFDKFKISEGHIKPFARKLIELIILCRREIDISDNFKALDSMVCRRIDYICKKFNYRWINSIIDTYADMGTDTQMLQGMILSQYMCNLVALQVENKSAVSHYEYVNDFGDEVILMRPGACNRFPHLFERMDKSITTEPLKSLWFNRLRSDLDQNKTSWAHIASYSNSGVYYRMYNKVDLPGFVNTHKCKNILLWRERDEDFISKITECKSLKYLIEAESVDDIKFDTVWDFVYFGDQIDTMLNWKDLKFGKRAITASSVHSESCTELYQSLLAPGVKSFQSVLEKSEPHGWFACAHR